VAVEYAASQALHHFHLGLLGAGLSLVKGAIDDLHVKSAANKYAPENGEAYGGKMETLGTQPIP
jgi:hypothetical protein